MEASEVVIVGIEDTSLDPVTFHIMSTVGTTTPVPNQPHIAGFNDYMYGDPYLPSSPSDEDLLQVSNILSPALLSDGVSRSSSVSRIVHGSSRPSASPPASFHHLQAYGEEQQPDLAISFDFCNPSGDCDLITDPSYDLDFLGEEPIQQSQRGQDETIDHVMDSDLARIFYSGNDDAPMSMPDVQRDVVSKQTDISIPEAASTATSGKPSLRLMHRASIGTATHSSQLMSPVPTDTASQGSQEDLGSPAMWRNFPEDGTYNNTMALDTSSSSMEQSVHSISVMAMNGEASDNELTRYPRYDANMVPCVRVEAFSRGDSPVRVPTSLLKSGSKRSHTSLSTSFLAPLQDDSSVDEEDLEPQRYRTSMDTDTLNEVEAHARNGVDPDKRDAIRDATVSNFKDREDQVQVAEKNADVENWITKSANTEQADVNHTSCFLDLTLPNARGRATTIQVASSSRRPLSCTNISLFQEVNDAMPLPSRPDTDDDRTASEQKSWMDRREQGPLFRQKLWEDQLRDSNLQEFATQPPTANDAMHRLHQQSLEFDSASRVATWGTRRASVNDLEDIFHRMKIGKDKDKDGKHSFLEKLFPKRHSGTDKRKESESSRQSHNRPGFTEYGREESQDSRKESTGSLLTLHRSASSGKRPKTPKLNTTSAMAAMTTQIAALGGSFSPSADPSPTSPSGAAGAWPMMKNAIRRTRSRSDLHKSAASSTTDLGLAGLWSKQGGPPLPTLNSPPVEQRVAGPFGNVEDLEENEDDDDEAGSSTDLPPSSVPIIATLDGFRNHVREINPNLPKFLVERIGQEQLRRYKKIVEWKVQHTKAISMHNCESRKYCVELGGEPAYLPQKKTVKEPEISHTGFSQTVVQSSDEDLNASAEGAVVASQFPTGVPLPPAKRLPAEFECSLCFKVKKFHKPSDWSKHVHEDVQPFTCTFEACPDPKSFKRKADWVRHENERHRKLEWWICNIPDCTHKCYRKDNFVQHLVREHKMPEPKLKTTKPNRPNVRGPSSRTARAGKLPMDFSNDGDANLEHFEQVWSLVEQCKHNSLQLPKDELCKFCGMTCTSWKKLTVHLAKHMEQISMPIIELVKECKVTSDTIISPIERRVPQKPHSSPASQPDTSRHESVGTPPNMGETASRSISQQSGASSGPNLQTAYFNAAPEARHPNIHQHDQGMGISFPGQTQHHSPAHGSSPMVTHGHSTFRMAPSNQFMSINPAPGMPRSVNPSAQNMFHATAPPTSQAQASSYAAPYSQEMAYGYQPAYSRPTAMSQYPYGLDAVPGFPPQPTVSPPLPMNYGLVNGIPYPPPMNDPAFYHPYQQSSAYPQQ